METFFNPTALAALVTALFTGAGGTWLAFKQFHVNRAKTAHEIEASLRSELREDIEKYRKDTEELRTKVTQLFDANLTLKHTNANLLQQIRALNNRIDRMHSDKKAEATKVASIAIATTKKSKKKSKGVENGTPSK